MRVFIMTFSALLLLGACGPSAQQKAAEEKAKMDSVAAATKAREDKRHELEIEISNLTNDYDSLKERIKIRMADLQGEKTRLESIESFHLLRTSAEKAEQVKNQSLVILNLEDEINTLRQQMNTTESKLLQVKEELKIF